ncbi:30S ribosomal protein S19 [archaeon CG10_big_fil_rev_8_21_14_0_10_43_11]|nr:MAG: 30S ribosomal protein S19 [archaeon CG10_big_fil_rev_8_21_14_0_10_43_11]
MAKKRFSQRKGQKQSSDDLLFRKKEFKYRGNSLEELQALSLDELKKLLPARARRSVERGFSERHQKLLEKIKKTPLPEEGKKIKIIKTHSRDMLVLPNMVGYVLGVHNGKEYVEVRVRPRMVGHYLGEFALTRKPVSHGSPGIGASKSSMASASKK